MALAVLTVALTGLAAAITAFAVYGWALRLEDSVAARTLAFTTIVFSQLFCACGFLSKTQPVWHVKTWPTCALGRRLSEL